MYVLSGVWECRHFYSAYFALQLLLLFDGVRVHIGIFRGRFVLDFRFEFNALRIVAFRAVLGDLPVGFRIQVLRFDCWDVPHVPGNMRIDLNSSWFVPVFVGGHVTHVPSNRVLFAFYFCHAIEVTNIINKYIEIILHQHSSSKISNKRKLKYSISNRPISFYIPEIIIIEGIKG